MERTHAGAVNEELPRERLILEKLLEGCLPREGPLSGAVEECEISSALEGRSCRDNIR